MEKKDRIRKSKFLSFILRHSPEYIGIELGLEGWVDIDTLLEKCSVVINITREELEEIVFSCDKQRFSIKDRMIRANQGHSTEVDMRFKPLIPPDELYHGTSETKTKLIYQKGILRMNRQYVHLSVDEETAKKVGKRHGYPCILVVDSEKMYKDGFRFYLSENEVWMTEYVPVYCIKKTLLI